MSHQNRDSRVISVDSDPKFRPTTPKPKFTILFLVVIDVYYRNKSRKLLEQVAMNFSIAPLYKFLIKNLYANAYPRPTMSPSHFSDKDSSTSASVYALMQRLFPRKADVVGRRLAARIGGRAPVIPGENGGDHFDTVAKFESCPFKIFGDF